MNLSRPAKVELETRMTLKMWVRPSGTVRE
jgi:hypothetical protein